MKYAVDLNERSSLCSSCLGLQKMAVQWQFILWLENVKHFCLCFPEDLVCVCVAVFFHYCLLENCFTLHSRFVLIWNLACWLSFQHSMSKEFLSFSLALSRSCSKTAFFFFFVLSHRAEEQWENSCYYFLVWNLWENSYLGFYS